MNRNEKIKKLGNAIRAYRGKFNGRTGKWIQPPDEEAGQRVVGWMLRLDLNLREGMEAVHGFKTYIELNDWLRKLS